MQKTFTYPKFDYVRPPELAEGRDGHYAVIVVGAGPVGLTAAIDLAHQGQPVLLLDDDDTVSIGSRGVCYAKRTLEVLDRIGCDNRFVDKGVSWDVGRTFFGEGEVFNFNLRPQAQHLRPGMINLQQYYLEQYLIERTGDVPTYLINADVHSVWLNSAALRREGFDSSEAFHPGDSGLLREEPAFEISRRLNAADPLLGDRLVRRQRSARKADAFLAELAMLTPGDLLVHADHGIGRRITTYEYRRVVNYAMDLGLSDGYMQQKSSAKEEYTPSFDLTGV